VAVNRYVRENIQSFIQNYIQPRFTPLDKITKDPHNFVSSLNEIWSHYQIFIFSFFHVSDKLTEFYQGFHRMNNAKDH
jgi:hypothetical protein